MGFGFWTGRAKERPFSRAIDDPAQVPKPILDLAPDRQKPPYCDLCWVEWESKTPFVRKGHPSNYGYYHLGCWARHSWKRGWVNE